jgi:DNA replication protein DnaC
MSLETNQREMLTKAWPWQTIPKQYRMMGKPSERITNAAKDCIGYIDETNQLQILTLTGPVGTGKTTAACQLAAWMAHGWEWMQPENVQYQLALRMGWLDAEDRERMGRKDCYLLILDDLSAGLTAAGLSNTLELIETRLAWHRRTIITTSLTLQEIATCEVRAHGREIGLASRMGGGGVIALRGEDRRLQ